MKCQFPAKRKTPQNYSKPQLNLGFSFWGIPTASPGPFTLGRCALPNVRCLLIYSENDPINFLLLDVQTSPDSCCFEQILFDNLLQKIWWTEFGRRIPSVSSYGSMHHCARLDLYTPVRWGPNTLNRAGVPGSSCAQLSLPQKARRPLQGTSFTLKTKPDHRRIKQTTLQKF